MRYPQMNVIQQARLVTESFTGYNHNARIPDGALYEETNMSSDQYPLLAPRRQRGTYAETENAQGLIAKDSLCWVADGKFYMNSYPVEGLRLEDTGEKQLISMGAYVVILPDKKYINTADITDYGNIEHTFTTTGKVKYTPCTQDGAGYEVKFRGAEEPVNPADGDYWMDTGSKPNALKVWSDTQAMWVTIPTVYIKIENPNIGQGFSEGDGVRISGLENEENEDLKAISGSFVLWGKTDNSIIIVGLLGQAVEKDTEITVSRRMPTMDFVVESGNRLWGCRYGTSRDGKTVNEIYASKLGDFKNWESYLGVATDSYAVSLGTDGPFTGAATHLGYPLFFKQDWIHKIYGSYPANYQVQSTKCRGVQKGSEKSLTTVNEVLYYKSSTCVCAYDGSLPADVGQALGTEAYGKAVGGSLGSKYYLSMEGAKGRSLFVYDTAKGIWCREDDTDPMCFAEARDELYYIDRKDGRIRSVNGTGEADTEPIRWEVVTGEIGLTTVSEQYTVSDINQKFLAKLVIRLSMEPGSWLRVKIMYDSCGKWEDAARLECKNLRSYTLPIRPKRCDHLRLKIYGEGEAKIYSIAKMMETASDMTDGIGQMLDF